MKKRGITYFKKLTAVLLSAVMMLCCADLEAAAGSYFSGSITADDLDIPVGGISIDVYGSKLKYSANGLKRYEHYYSGTVTTDSNGNFSFRRPTTKTLLKVNLGTLPAGTGVNEQTRLVASKYDDTFTLSYVNDINIIKSGNGSFFKVNLTSADGSLLFADQEVTDTVSSGTVGVTYDTLNSVRLDRTVTVRAAGLVKSSTFLLDISDYTVSGKLTCLLNYGIIDDDTVQEIVDEYKVDTASSEDPRPDFYNERTYTSGNFMLHSEQGTANVDQYERILDEIVDIYFRKYDFLEPYHEFVKGSTTTRDKYFHIYLVDPDVIRIDSAVSPKNVVGKTMKIDESDPTKGCYIVLAPSETLNFKWALAHEIFHGIIYKYTGKNQAGWFKEAFANYGSVLCLGGTIKNLNKHMSYYLNSTVYTLSSSAYYKNRQYGIYLLPLYIHNNYGGVETIKNILWAYAKTSSAYRAIDNGLKATKSKYSFASLFAGFKDMNSYTAFYRMTDLSSGKSASSSVKGAERTVIYSFGNQDTVITPQMTLTGNSAAYFEYRAPSSASGTLTVTVETPSGVSNASFNLILKGKKITIPTGKKTSELVTFVVSNFGGNVNTVVLAAGNTSMVAKDEISFFATAYFKES